MAMRSVRVRVFVDSESSVVPTGPQPPKWVHASEGSPLDRELNSAYRSLEVAQVAERHLKVH